MTGTCGRWMALCAVSLACGHIGRARAAESQPPPAMKVLWQKEFTPDADLACFLGPVTLNNATGRLFIGGTSYRPRKYSENKCWLLEVDEASGAVHRTMFFKDIAGRGGPITMLASSLLNSLTVSGNNDVTLVGRFDGLASPLSMIRPGQSGAASRPVELAGHKDGSSQNVRTEESVQIRHGIRLPGDHLLLIGTRRDGGLALKVDSQGACLSDKSINMEQGRKDDFTDGVPVGDQGGFVAVGYSANARPTRSGAKIPDMTGDGFIAQCSAQGDVVAKDLFPASPVMTEWPRMCRLSSGRFVVVYGGIPESGCSRVMIRAYSPDLKPLWEKPVIASEKRGIPGSLAIASTSTGRFVVAANVDAGNLRVFEYDEEGNQLAGLSMDREVWLLQIGLACMDDKALVVFGSRPKTTAQGEELSGIKIMALELQ